VEVKIRMDGLIFPRMKYSSTIIYALLCGVLTVISVWTSYHGIADWSYRAQKGFWNGMGFLALLLIVSSVMLWYVKKSILNAKQKERGAYNWASGSVIKGLREAHVSLGWLAFTLGLGHSVFYMINLPTRMNHIYSGVIALVGMSVVIITGLMYKHRIISIKTCKTCHKVISGVFGVLLVMHI
jgi:hypothetical protein